jgi:hypothetical protein
MVPNGNLIMVVLCPDVTSSPVLLNNEREGSSDAVARTTMKIATKSKEILLIFLAPTTTTSRPL